MQPLILDAIRSNVKSEDWQTQDFLPIKLVCREWSQEETQEILKLKRKLIELLNNDDFEAAVSTLETDIVRLQDFVSCERALETANVEEAQPLVWNEMLIKNMISKVIVNENDNLLIKFKNGKSVSVRID